MPRCNCYLPALKLRMYSNTLNILSQFQVMTMYAQVTCYMPPRSPLPNFRRAPFMLLASHLIAASNDVNIFIVYAIYTFHASLTLIYADTLEIKAKYLMEPVRQFKIHSMTWLKKGAFIARLSTLGDAMFWFLCKLQRITLRTFLALENMTLLTSSKVEESLCSKLSSIILIMMSTQKGTVV
jgi:hypothetical protein